MINQYAKEILQYLSVEYLEQDDKSIAIYTTKRNIADWMWRIVSDVKAVDGFWNQEIARVIYQVIEKISTAPDSMNPTKEYPDELSDLRDFIGDFAPPCYESDLLEWLQLPVRWSFCDDAIKCDSFHNVENPLYAVIHDGWGRWHEEIKKVIVEKLLQRWEESLCIQ